MAAPKFDNVEIEAVNSFFKSSVGKKVLEALDNKAEEKNNLLHTVNLVSGNFKPEQVGIRCQMIAAEVQAIKEIVETLQVFGDYYADQD